MDKRMTLSRYDALESDEFGLCPKVVIASLALSAGLWASMIFAYTLVA